MEDRYYYLQLFIRFARELSESEKERVAQADDNEVFEDLPDKKPALDDFKRELDRFRDLYAQSERLEDIMLFDKWFRVNLKPLKQSILNTVCKWSNMLKQYLVNRVHKT